MGQGRIVGPTGLEEFAKGRSGKSTRRHSVGIANLLPISGERGNVLRSEGRAAKVSQLDGKGLAFV